MTTTTSTNSRPYQYCRLLGFNILAQRGGARWLLHIRDGVDPKLSRARVALDRRQLRELADTLQEAYDFSQRNYARGGRSREYSINLGGVGPIQFEALSNRSVMWAELGPFIIDIDVLTVPHTIAELEQLLELLPKE